MLRFATRYGSNGVSSWLRQPYCRYGVHARTTLRARMISGDSFGALTDVEKIMLDSVKATGPISFSTFMQLSLGHPTYGYYMKPEHAVFGTQGDFVTSPEISQMFGELVALWMIKQWMDTNVKVPFRVVELGPGRGTLMEDIIRVSDIERVVIYFSPSSFQVLNQLPATPGKLKSVHLVESSVSMRASQEGKLRKASQEDGFEIMWHDAIEEIEHEEDVFTMLVAHEFFDALPVNVIERTQQGWNEVLIAPSSDPSIKYTMPSSESDSKPVSPPQFQPMSSRWTRVLSPSPTGSSTLLGLASPRFSSLPIGTRIEVSRASMNHARNIGKLIGTKGGGCALIVDYGADKAFGDSLRAFKQHKIVDLFCRPGECDVTANVDFGLLKESMADLVSTHGPISQRDFLTRMGIEIRAGALMRSASSPERKKAIEEGANRLVDPLGMGEQYKVLGVVAKSSEEGQAVDEVWPFTNTASTHP
ncbi:S-adenosyl-L-methionine-dependent methyltransferase [Suillus paluster]|uniref:S-adenosyl-L-methionine-dependent methyltransferase n=1 Tax=Suillus paluster TaxID=48578 RepID=UPI001B864938|nr:S-adenosyl-L-methionine-dependent methyltransferase [Suillus paluster]KAG1739172.1 S-adenosyl-L-methionine-dependent methyltransferase [Suillus paluster]